MSFIVGQAKNDSSEVFSEILQHLSPHRYSWAPTWKIGEIDLSITNAVINIWIAVLCVIFVFWVASSKSKLIPKRVQNLVELALDWVKDNIVYTVMSPVDARAWGPLIASIFFFILFLNIVGLIPIIGFTPTANIFVTFTLAINVYVLAIFVGMTRHGPLTFWRKTLVPSGVPKFLAIAMAILIEPISQLARPFSLAVRLFANMLADHLLLLVFAGFIFISGGFVLFIVLPVAVAGLVVFTAFALLIAVIQAMVFALLTTIYLNDALHPGH